MADINKVVNIKVESDIDNVTKDVKKLNKGLKNTSEASSEMKSQLNTISGGKLSALTGIIGKVRLAFVSLRTAIIASGIGALALAVLAVGRAFKDSEEGQNKFAKLMGVIGAVVGNLTDLLANLGEKIISVFENPKEAIKSFGELVKKNISNRLEGLTELIPKLGAAITLLFKGEFTEAGKVAGDAVAKVALGVENFTDKVIDATEAVAEFGREQVREGNQAAKVADMRAKAEKEERKLLIQRATLENKIAHLRLKSREEDRFSADERKQALLDAQKLEDTLLEKETKVLKLRADAQTLENTFSRSNKENLNEEARLQAEVIRQQARRTNAQRQTQRELNRLNKEILADNKRTLAEEQKAIDDLDKFKKDLADKNEDERIDKIKNEKSERLLKLEELKLEEEEKNALKLEIEQRYIDDLNAIKEADRIAKKAKDEKDAEESRKIREEELLLDIEIELGTFEEKRLRLQNQRKIIIDDETLSAEQKAELLEKIGNSEVKIQEEQQRAKQRALMAYANIAGSISNLIGKQTVAGKALAVADATISTYLSAQKAYESQLSIPTPDAPVRASIAAGVAIAQGIGSVKNILSTKIPNQGGGGGSLPKGSGSRSFSIPAPNTSSFSTPNQAESQANVQANANAQFSQSNPIQAYVTSTDVSSANALERNRIEDAGF